MPFYEFFCKSCDLVRKRFIKLEDFDTQKSAQVCEVCSEYMTLKIGVPNILIRGGVEAEMRAKKEVDRFKQAQASLREDGITQTEVEVGLEWMQRYEEKHGLPKGSVTGKRNLKYVSTPDGKVKLSPESDALLTAQSRQKRKMAREQRGEQT